jgi:hypothetical protein
MTQSNRSSDTLTTAAPKAATSPPESGWVLTPGSERYSREELLARYRRQRALPQDPFEQGGKPKPSAGYRHRIMSQQQPGARFVERPEAQASPGPLRRTLTLPQTFSIAFAMALAAGVGVGMVNASLFSGTRTPEQIAGTVTSLQASASTVLSPAPAVQSPAATFQPAQMTVISKKTVPTVALEVADTAGETNSFIPLALNAEPAQLGSDIILKISGIPAGAYLTSGRRDDDENWALTLGELKNLKLVVPDASTSKIDLAVAAFEPKTGELAAPVKTMTVALSDVQVRPTSAPPPAQTAEPPAAVAAEVVRPQPIPPPDSTTLALQTQETPAMQTLVLEGDSLLKSGDVRKARRAYEQAWGGGSLAGAFGMARSYDPIVIASLVLKNAVADKVQAVAWYERAATAGHMGAADAIVRLRMKP